MNIKKFNRGEIIVRVESSDTGDRSYMGEKLTYIGIANGQIYLEPGEDSFHAKVLSKRIDLATDQWSEGWEKWIDVDNTEAKGNTELSLISALEKAVKDENYELLGRLKAIFDKHT